MKNLYHLTICIGLTTFSFADFLVKPYFQSGTDNFVNGKEQRTLVFEMEPQDDDVKIILKDDKELACTLESKKSRFNTLFYKSIFKELEPGKSYHYQILQKEKVIFEDDFKISLDDAPLQLTVFGCAGENTEGQKQVANFLKSQPTDGIIYLGDFTYSTQENNPVTAGTATAFRQNFFKPYEEVFSKVPFYPVVGNNEMDTSNFDTDKDPYAYFDYVSHPLNGPETMSVSVLKGNQESIDSFLKEVSHYKKGTNYSVDFYKSGKPLVHLQVVDGNAWMDPSQKQLQAWMEKDLKETKAPWKIACIHQPLASCTQRLKPFMHLLDKFSSVLENNKDDIIQKIKRTMITGKNHVRQYAKVWQENGVQLVLSAHLHGYERSKPLELFLKKDNEKEVEKFEEKVGKGPVHIITGAAGAHLHMGTLIESLVPAEVKSLRTSSAPQNFFQFLESQFALFLDHTEKIDFINYSFSNLKIDARKLILEQVNKDGKIIDTFELKL